MIKNQFFINACQISKQIKSITVSKMYNFLPFLYYKVGKSIYVYDLGCLYTFIIICGKI